MAGINDAIKSAQANAAATVDDADVVEHTGGTAVMERPNAAPAAPMPKPSMGNMMGASGISNKVKGWLKVNEHGIQIGKDKKLLDSLRVRITMSEDEGFFVKQSFKYGQPVQYVSTYDGTMTDKGVPWDQKLAEVAEMFGQAPTVFPSADIIMVVDEDIALKDSKVEAGTPLGHTTSRSNWRNWEELFQQVMKADKLGQEVIVDVGFEDVNHNGYTWGVLTFELVE